MTERSSFQLPRRCERLAKPEAALVEIAPPIHSEIKVAGTPINFAASRVRRSKLSSGGVSSNPVRKTASTRYSASNGESPSRVGQVGGVTKGTSGLLIGRAGARLINSYYSRVDLNFTLKFLPRIATAR